MGTLLAPGGVDEVVVCWFHVDWDSYGSSLNYNYLNLVTGYFILFLGRFSLSEGKFKFDRVGTLIKIIQYLKTFIVGT